MEKYEIHLPLGEGIRSASSNGKKNGRIKRHKAGRKLSRKARRRRRRKRIRQMMAAFMLLTTAAAAVLGVAGIIWLAAGWFAPAAMPAQVGVAPPSFPNAKEGGGEAESESRARFPYAGRSASYVEITDAAVRSPYIALLDVENNEIIAGRSCNERIYPASMTKVMTLIVAVENLKDRNRTFVMNDGLLYPLYLNNASVAGFLSGEEVPAGDLLYGLILPSGADAAEALALMTAGSKEAFVALMNAKCRELGLRNTRFCNVTGLHDNEHYTTATEMAMLMSYAMKNPVCAKVLSEFQYTTAATPQHPEGILLTSTMFSRMYGDEAKGAVITAGKTGFTDQAGNCLVSFAQRGERHYIAVTAGAGSKWHPIFDDFKLYESYAP